MTVRCLTLILLAAGSSLAQMSDIGGYVKDAAGKPVANAAIQILRQDVSRSYQAKTDKRGSYYYQGLPVGFYAIKVIVEGKDMTGVTGLRTQPGAPLEVNFDLGATPQEQESRIRSSLKKLGVEWSYVKIMTAPQAPPAPAPPPAQSSSPASQPPPVPAAPQTGSEAPRLFKAGVEALEAKKYAEAVASLSSAGEIDAAQPAVWANLAAAYVGLAGGSSGAEAAAAMERALTAYAKALELKPGDAATHYSYALARAKTRKWEQMRAEMKKSADLDPANAYRTYYNLGTLLSNGGEQEGASEAFRLAVAAAPEEPKNAESYYQSALSLVSQARVGADGKLIPAAGTVGLLQKYLLLTPNAPNPPAARDLLKTMGEGKK